MNFMNCNYNSQKHDTKSMALLQEESSLTSGHVPLAKCDWKQAPKQQPSEVPYKTTKTNINFTPNSSFHERSSFKAPWLKAFFHSRTQYADFQATAEKLNGTKQVHPKVKPTAAESAAAASYAQMKRISSAQILHRRNGCMPLTFEWALEELLASDRSLHQKYNSCPSSQIPPRDQSCDRGNRAVNTGKSLPSHVMGRGDNRHFPNSGSVSARGINDRTSVVVRNETERNGTSAVVDVERRRCRTLPHDVKDLFQEMDRKMTLSSCSLPETSHTDVISRFLAAEG